jgi:hypothetical protein
MTAPRRRKVDVDYNMVMKNRLTMKHKLKRIKEREIPEFAT